MDKKKVAYWLTTGLTALALLGSGVGKLMQAEPLVQSMEHLGYPTYILTLLGFWMVAGAIALLTPGAARIKEWAYAGIAFQMTGAFFSHLMAGDAFAVSAPPLFVLALAVGSYLLRPANRTLQAR